MPGRTNLSFSGSFPSFSSSSDSSHALHGVSNSTTPATTVTTTISQSPILGNGNSTGTGTGSGSGAGKALSSIGIGLGFGSLPGSANSSPTRQSHHQRSVSSWRSSRSRKKASNTGLAEKFKHDKHDPFMSAFAPPDDESPEDRVRRLEQEAEARRVSDAIDEQIKLERAQQKRGKIVRVLLLGQSESGKSTTLRQFQRLYTPSAFREERILWRAVIQLNLVRSVRLILDTLAIHLAARSRSKSIHSDSEFESEWERDVREKERHSERREERDREWENVYEGRSGFAALGMGGNSNSISNGTAGDFEFLRGRSYPQSDMQSVSTKSRSMRDRIGKKERGRMANGGGSVGTTNGQSVSAHLHELTLKLLPLRHIEQLLIAKLVPPDEDEATHLSFMGQTSSNGAGGQRTLFAGIGGGGGEVIDDGEEEREVFVRPGTAWKGYRALGRRSFGASASMSQTPPWERDLKGKARDNGMEEEDEPTRVLVECVGDIQRIWSDPVVREVLRRRKVRVEERPGFFLNDLERIASPTYMPSDDDVLKARLKTVGVSEHRFHMEAAAGRESGTEWRIVDVGGSRSQRPKWIPYFEDVNAIIFLAPISGFDQVLAEDRSVNRLEDSVLLWKMICANKLLANVELVLFLNKCDILEKKLRAGVKLAKYVKSYGGRGNESETVQKYFRAKFAAIQREHSPNPRKFYGFCTSVTEIITTSGILVSVRDIVIREHLKRSKLL